MVNSKKDPRCRYCEECILEVNCHTCHIFRSRSGAEITIRNDKPSIIKIKNFEPEINKEDFYNWNEDAIYC